MSRVRIVAALALLAVSLLFFVDRGYHNEHATLQSIDFKQPYASAKCLLQGCDPYSESDTHAAFTRAHGTDDHGVFVPYSALYPPFSLELLTSLAALPYGQAHRLWMATIAASFIVAVLLTASLCLGLGVTAPIVVLAAFAADSTILLMEGQISGVAISLMVVGFWCLLRQRLPGVGVVCLAVAVLLKPHDAGLPILYLCLAGERWRKALGLIAACCTLCVVSSVLWCSSHPASRHWLPELRANIVGNETGGNANDPSRGNEAAMQSVSLEALIGALTTHESTYNSAAYLGSSLLLLAWGYPALRMPNGFEKHVLAIATVSCMALLPVYHRQYDTRIFLLAFPAGAFLWRWRPRSWGAGSLLLLSAATVATAHQTLHWIARKPGEIAAAGPLKTLLAYRPLPWTALLLSLFFLAAFYQAMFAQRAGKLSLTAPPNSLG